MQRARTFLLGCLFLALPLSGGPSMAVERNTRPADVTGARLATPGSGSPATGLLPAAGVASLARAAEHAGAGAPGHCLATPWWADLRADADEDEDDEEGEGDEEDEDDEDEEDDAGRKRRSRRPRSLQVSFESDPLGRADVVVDGDALTRLTWEPDPPAFPGDLPGSLEANYDARLAPGRLGFALPQAWTQDDPFTAAAVLVIDPAGFTADPAGFFQISWGLWNDAATGMDRTGDPSDFTADTFELLGFDWFPNVSAFGGPFLSPGVFGAADPSSPSFPFIGSFANFAFASVEVALPLGEPLLTLLEHEPANDALVVSVHRIVGPGRAVPLSGGVVTIPLQDLGLREYTVDTLGLTLWHDGFGDPANPSVRADVTYHWLEARTGAACRPEQLLPGGR